MGIRWFPREELGSTDPKREEEERGGGGGKGRSLVLEGASEVELSFEEDSFLLRCLDLEEEDEEEEPVRRTTSEVMEEEDGGGRRRLRPGASLRERRSFCTHLGEKENEKVTIHLTLLPARSEVVS